MTPDDFRQLLDEERGVDELLEYDDDGVSRRATRLTLADRLDADDEDNRLFGGLF